MKIYDIAQEVFGCAVFPGDSSPERKILSKISDGEICNLTELKMCAHNGTHVDAPYHFLDEGKTIDQVDLKRFVGYAYVAGHEGILKAEDAELILKNAREASDKSDITDCDAYNRILIKGDAEGLVNMPLQIKGLKLSISLREDTDRENTIWVSLRSVDDFPCNEVAARFFNGGGHLNASGGRLNCSLDEAVEIVKKALVAFEDTLKK